MILSRLPRLRVMSKSRKIALFARVHEAFRHRFKFFPPGANLACFRRRDAFIRGGGGDNMEEVGKFLDDLVGRGDEMMRMRGFFGV